MQPISPIFTEKNQYHGINPHLNSRLQVDGWDTFHTVHITDLWKYLNSQLRGIGYQAELEDSLQIRREQGPLRSPEADLLIWDPNLLRSAQGPAGFPTADVFVRHPKGVAALTMERDRDEDIEFFRAIAIYSPDSSGKGEPVAWIELLSPTNKEGGRHYDEYLDKREGVLATGTCLFLEIDYLHESSPTYELADYTRRQEDSTAYHVGMAETRGVGLAGYDFVTISFGIDEPIPVIPMPLCGNDIAQLDLGSVYNRTYREAGYGININTPVDYRHVPVNIERYSLADQKRIVDRLQTVQMAHEADMDLEAGNEPLPIDQKRLEHWRQQRSERS